jgi:hypothetical protein
MGVLAFKLPCGRCQCEKNRITPGDFLLIAAPIMANPATFWDPVPGLQLMRGLATAWQGDFPGPSREISAGIFPGHRQSGLHYSLGGWSCRHIRQPCTAEEIMDKLEKRVGPEGRKLFEQFMAKVHRLEQQQALGAAGGDAIERALAIAAATDARPR